MTTSDQVVSSVLYVCGYGRSGSTLLDTTIAKRFGLLSAGELCHLARASGYPCGCGEAVGSCVLWGPLLPRLPSGPGLEEGIHSVRRASRNYAGYWRMVLAHTAAAGWPMVIDSSKTAWRQANRQRRLREIGVAVYPILIWRDFDGVLASRLAAHERRVGAVPNRSRRLVIEFETALSWAIANLAGLRSVRRSGGTSCVLSLAGFVANTDGAMALVGELVTDRESRPSSRKHENHSIAGNRLRLDQPIEPTDERSRASSFKRTRPSWLITRPIEKFLARRTSVLDGSTD